MRGKKKVTKEDKEWTTKVKLRDHWKCVICGEPHFLNSHHIIPREMSETTFDIENGISLCPRHHRFSRKISAHQNPLAFIMWMERHKPKQLNYLKAICNMTLIDPGLL